MVGGQINSAPRSAASFPIQLLVNYWEIVPSQMAAKLEVLYRAGVKHIATFVPWQAVESDISHSLTRFLQAVADRKMTVSLIVTPELGVHFTSSGLPKDVMNRTDTVAQHFQKGPVQISLAPNSFHLPSLLSPEFTKRYYSFLSRIDNLLYDFEKTQGRSLDNVTLVMTGGFWKYYRSPVASATGAYSGIAGDYSNNGGVVYRQAVEDFYSQPEFNDPNPAAAQRWKTQAMDEVNRRWFHQHSEAVFRNRTLQFVRKRVSSVQLREIELFTPEADPALAYSFFLNAVSGCGSDFARLSGVLEDSAKMSTMAGFAPAVSCVHWSSLGGFKSLADTEKQFLILKSLLMMGPQGGGVLLDEAEWFSLSRSFRTHVEAFAEAIGNGDLTLKAKALYLCPHLWSGPTAFWSEISKKAGLAATKLASLELALQNEDARLLMLDPAFIITRDVVRKLVQWASNQGKVLVLPRSTLYTESARSALELIASGSTRIEMQLGVSYRILPLGEGKLVIYDAPEKAFTQEMNAPEWRNFISAVLALSEIEPECQSSDSRVSLIQLERKDQSSGLFVLNGSHRPVTADVIFPVDVSVSDLALEVRRNLSETLEPAAAAASARRFSLDVPACGILPLAIDRVGLGTLSEQKAADQLSRLGRDNAAAAAANELPGLGLSDLGTEGGVSWN